MMTQIKRTIPRPAGLGDVAVDGLLNGLVAGFAMAFFLVLVAVLLGEMPGAVLSRFDPSPLPNAFRGGLMHLAVAAVYGAVFAVPIWLARAQIHTPGITILAGVAFGLVLFCVGELVILPTSHSALRELPIWDFALAHLVYGLILGSLMGRAIE